jgi:hypothetical protein
MIPEQSAKLRRSAVESKDRLLKEVNEISSLPEFMLRSAMIGTALDMTQGLWAELGYAYKAQEILEALLSKLSNLEDNAKDFGEIIQVQFARTIIEKQIEGFYQLQQERMSKDASLN